MKKSGRRRAAGLLAALVLSWLPIEAEARSAAQDDRQEQIEALSRVLGMTTAEIEAMGLSSEEMQFLLEGYTEETVVVGTRAQPRTVAESPVPVDVLSSFDIIRQGAVNLQEQLRTIVPSFNINTQPISDASTVVRPAMLRNLAPDHTLVLINGKRRHRSSIIDWHGGNGVAFGSQGPDISAIPSIALRQVEVLRDGAAAQYGSDAIAGVMNFQLKDAPSGGTLTFNTGTFGSGDGEAFNVAGNVGLPLGATGFANLSLEYGSSNPTNRSAPRSDAIALRAAGNADIASDTPQVWGSPRVDDDLKLFGNFGYTAANGVQFYSHTNYASKKVTGGFFFRNPNTRGGVFSIDGGKTLLIGDALMAAGTSSANCPTVAITDHVADPASLEQVFDDPNCFSFRERFPGGFTPNFGGEATDVSLVVGVRGFTAAGFVWDVSGSVGAHETGLFISDTVNASLGPDTPTAFDLGSNRQRETGVNFDVSYAATEMVNLAVGAEWRDEQYQTTEGHPTSWTVGPYGRGQGFSAGSNGFFGYGPLAAGTWNRSNVAVYGDLELNDPDDGWTLGAAVRVENFEDFGTTTNGKVSGRLGFVRASVSSGFRAPTPGQQNGFNIATIFDLPEYFDLTGMTTEIDQACGALLGLACGDAVGTAMEFSPRDTFDHEGVGYRSRTCQHERRCHRPGASAEWYQHDLAGHRARRVRAGRLLESSTTPIRRSAPATPTPGFSLSAATRFTGHGFGHAVADPRLGHDVGGAGGNVAQLAAEFLHEGAHEAGVTAVLWSPDPSQQVTRASRPVRR